PFRVLRLKPFLRLAVFSEARWASSSPCIAASVSCLINGVRMPSLPVRSLPSRRACRAPSISNVGLVMSHLFSVQSKEMTQNSEHYPRLRCLHHQCSQDLALWWKVFRETSLHYSLDKECESMHLVSETLLG